MRYIFFGTPRFAEIVLQKLIDNKFPPVAIVCNPDKPIGKKKVITPPLTKILAKKHNIKVFQPEKIKDAKLPKVNLFVVAAYAKIIPNSILSLPKLGTIGVHPSLLPKYRGATPIQTALLNSEKETGTTLYLMDKEVDHGPILIQKELDIQENETYLSLEKKLAELGANLLLELASRFPNINPREQDHLKATSTKKFETKDAEVDFTKDSDLKIYRKIQALNPEPGVYTFTLPGYEDKRVKLLKAKYENQKLNIKTIQVAGKTPKNIGACQ